MPMNPQHVYRKAKKYLRGVNLFMLISYFWPKFHVVWHTQTYIHMIWWLINYVLHGCSMISQWIYYYLFIWFGPVSYLLIIYGIYPVMASEFLFACTIFGSLAWDYQNGLLFQYLHQLRAYIPYEVTIYERMFFGSLSVLLLAVICQQYYAHFAQKWVKKLPKPSKKRAKFMQKNSIFPSVNLLQAAKHKTLHWNHKDRLELLKQTLADYDIAGEIVSYSIGPVVTLYKFQPEPGLKESKIISLSSDIARSMSALSARIAAIPGHNLIGIELSNPARQTVYLRELLESDEFQKTPGLTLALGCDISGKPFIANLETMPHMLIAGTTGSGKSVSIHTLLLSILYKHTPQTCKLIMIDPKMLELSMYNDLPHLLIPVVTNPKLAIVALKWAIQEMETRYKSMSQAQVRNITEYNEKFKEQLPYIVIIVDEFADLMMVAGKEIDDAIQRLAQMARAAGIHLILATQRPSVDVITGTIKANFPTRLTFQLASKIDSRTILGDRGGADQLLGKGDMLYLNLSNLVRAHGPYVSNTEVEKVVNHWKQQQKPEYQDLELQVSEGEEESVNPVDDPMFDQVVEYVYRSQRPTASSIQREFSIGFNRAAKYLDIMEKMGKISAPDSRGRRKIIG